MAKETSETGTVTRKRSKKKKIIGQLKSELGMLYLIYQILLNSTVTLLSTNTKQGFSAAYCLQKGQLRDLHVDHLTKPQ